MARTFVEIAQSIFDDKNSRSELYSLNSTSKAAIFRNWVFISANAQQSLEIIQDRFKSEIETIIASNAVGTPSWYVERIKEFQLGDDLSLVGNVYRYQTIDPSKQIVAACSFIENSGGTVTLKTAKLNGVALTALLSITSLLADQLVVSGCTIYYDSIFDPDVVKTAVEGALQNFMNSLPFDGKLRLNDVIDVIQEVDGVEDVTITHLAIKTGSIIYFPSWKK
jgi:hypothetical protein